MSVLAVRSLASRHLFYGFSGLLMPYFQGYVMAVLGFHVVLTLIAATLFNKFRADLSLWYHLLFKGLNFYWLPEPPEAPDSSRTRKRPRQAKPADPVDFRQRLFCSPLSPEIILKLTYIEKLVWLIDYGLFGLIVFALSQTWVYLFPNDTAINVSIFWVLFSVAFSLQLLFAIMWKKFSTTTLSGERNVTICFGLVVFFLFMVLNMFGERYLVDSLNQGYEYLMENSREIANASKDFKIHKASPLLLYVLASFFSSLISTALMMPVVQYALLYNSYTKDNRSLKCLIQHLLFATPFLLIVLYLRPVEEAFLRRFPSLDEELYAALRLYSAVAWALLRVFSAKSFLQEYLENAKEKALAHSSHPAAFETLRSHLSYLGMTAVQLTAPALLILFAAAAQLALGHVYPLNHEASPAVADNNLNVLLDSRVQRNLWSHAVFTLLALHSGLSAIGLTFGI